MEICVLKNKFWLLEDSPISGIAPVFSLLILISLLFFSFAVNAQETPVAPAVQVPGAPGVTTPTIDNAGKPDATVKPAVKESNITGNPFSATSMESGKSAKGGMSRQEVVDLMHEMETRLGAQIAVQNQAQQNVDTKQLTDLLGSLTKTASVDDMIFIGCVNGKAVYRTPDQATIVINENEGTSKSKAEKMSLNRCKK